MGTRKASGQRDTRVPLATQASPSGRATRVSRPYHSAMSTGHQLPAGMGGSGPLAAGRVTLIGDLLEVGGEERPAVRDRYLAANPASAYYIDFGDFSFWRLEVCSVRYVGGYGRMSWVAAEDYAAAEADPLAGEAAAGILEHMNADHADSLVLFARVFGGRPDATEAVMTAVDRYGFDLVVGGPSGRAALRLGFDAPVATAVALRPAVIRLVERARAGGIESAGGNP